MPCFLDSGPKFTGLVSSNAGGIVLGHMSFRFWISFPIQEISAIEVGSCVKSRQISHVLAPKIFFRGQPPNFWTGIIKRTQISDIDHVLKFHGDRLNELEDLVAN